MAEIAIVSMTREHLSEVTALWQATEGLVLSDADHPEPLKRYLDCHPGISQVALAEGSVVGAVLCGHDGRRGYLYHLAVAKVFRMRGIGRRLVDASLEKLEEAGFSRCNLFVLDDNDQGKAFWRRAAGTIGPKSASCPKMFERPTRNTLAAAFLFIR